MNSTNCLPCAITLLLCGITNTEAATVLQTEAYNGHTYQLISEDSGARITWSSAQAAALTLGGNLVTVDDAGENSFLLNTFGPTAIATAPSGGGLVSLWLGFNDAVQEGQYVWADGSPDTYTNWVPGEPAGSYGDDDYAGMVISFGFGNPGQWHDIVSDFRFNDVTFGVVEIVPTPVPIPAGIWLLGSALAGIGLGRFRKLS